jgi:hypothetical protein
MSTYIFRCSVNTLIEKVDRMDQDMRKINERLIRVETIVEMATMQKGQGQAPMIE